MTDIFVVFDFLWKFVFFVSILSTFYFCSVLFLPKLFKKTSAIKIMAGIKTSKIILLMSFIANAFFLVFFDKELGIDCFGHFAIKEGSFGLTRMISIIWLIGFILYIVKDAVCYFWSFKKLNNCVIGSKTYTLNKKNGLKIDYFVTDRVDEAVVVGFIYPKIYISKSILDNTASLKQIILHEYIHFKNKDGIWSLLSLIIHRLNWFNPLSYISFKATKNNLEMSTDVQAVLEFNLSIFEYASNLIKLVSENQKINPLVSNVNGNFTQIHERILNLKKVHNGVNEKKTIFGWMMFLILALGLNESLAVTQQEQRADYQETMCFQVKHEIMIENLIQAKNIKTNRCE